MRKENNTPGISGHRGKSNCRAPGPPKASRLRHSHFPNISHLQPSRQTRGKRKGRAARKTILPAAAAGELPVRASLLPAPRRRPGTSISAILGPLPMLMPMLGSDSAFVCLARTRQAYCACEGAYLLLLCCLSAVLERLLRCGVRFITLFRCHGFGDE
ncbi:uncharacterized protein J3D65DRAFT_70868 [Phyllosticta citribraziliensis]|uniref:Uncharacterized protein n=1 Tax=Phyllosticta citribraziliensis TaxID=989973 RepID=A0ABR1LEU4_9PEZI